LSTNGASGFSTEQLSQVLFQALSTPLPDWISRGELVTL